MEAVEEDRESISRARDAIGVEAVAGARAVHGSGDESGFAEHFEVLRNGRLREVDDLHDLAAQTLASGAERREYAEARGMAEGFRQRREGVVSVCHGSSGGPDNLRPAGVWR